MLPSHLHIGRPFSPSPVQVCHKDTYIFKLRQRRARRHALLPWRGIRVNGRLSPARRRRTPATREAQGNSGVIERARRNYNETQSVYRRRDSKRKFKSAPAKVPTVINAAIIRKKSVREFSSFEYQNQVPPCQQQNA